MIVEYSFNNQVTKFCLSIIVNFGLLKTGAQICYDGQEEFDADNDSYI